MKRHIALRDNSQTTIDSVKEILTIAKVPFKEVEAHLENRCLGFSGNTADILIGHTIVSDIIDVQFSGYSEDGAYYTDYGLAEIERIVHEEKSRLVDYSEFEYTSEPNSVIVNEVCYDHRITVSNGYSFAADYRTNLDSKQEVYTEYMMSFRRAKGSKKSLFDVVSEVSNGKATLRGNIEQQITKRNEALKHNMVTLEQIMTEERIIGGLCVSGYEIDNGGI